MLLIKIDSFEVNNEKFIKSDVNTFINQYIKNNNLK